MFRQYKELVDNCRRVFNQPFSIVGFDSYVLGIRGCAELIITIRLTDIQNTSRDDYYGR